MRKKLFSIIAFVFIVTVVEAQVKFKLTRLPDNATYMVSLMPDETWSFPKNVTTTAQVTVRLPSYAHFIAGRIKSLVKDVTWTDNAYVESPKQDLANTYISFNLQTIGTRAFNFEAGKELPLFTFQNIGTTCFGSLNLVDNSSATTKNVVAGGYNIGQHISTLGAGGEAFSGNDGSSVACQGITAVKDIENSPLSILKAYPLPTTSELFIEWQISENSIDNVQLIVHNAVGETLETVNLKNTQSLQTTRLDVTKWAAGVYSFHLMSNKSISKSKTFVKM